MLWHDYVFWPLLFGLIGFTAFFVHRNEQRQERLAEPTTDSIRREVLLRVAFDAVLALAILGLTLAKLADHGWRVGFDAVAGFAATGLMLAAIGLIVRAGTRARRDLRAP